MNHDLKILPEYFGPVRLNLKNFEIRKQDRDFRPGDTLTLREFDGTQYTGRTARRRITYIYSGGLYGVLPGYCIIGMQMIYKKAVK